MQIGEEDASQKDERDRKLWIKIKKEEDARLTGEAHDLHLSQVNVSPSENSCSRHIHSMDMIDFHRHSKMNPCQMGDGTKMVMNP